MRYSNLIFNQAMEHSFEIDGVCYNGPRQKKKPGNKSTGNAGLEENGGDISKWNTECTTNEVDELQPK